MHNTHPLITYYKQTNDKNFPLILFVGREPNDNSKYSDLIGEYNFVKNSHSSMWNKSYGLIAKLNSPLKITELKEKCKSKKSSPIIFTNLSPTPVPNNKSPNKKQTIRQNIKPEQFTSHFNQILSKKIINRVELIIISVECNELSKAENYFKKLCKKHKKECLSIPYLANPTNSYKKICKSFKKKQINLIKKIFNKWETALN